MGREDTVRTLLNSIPIFTSRDWGSVERNGRAVELAKSIRAAVDQRDDAKMKELAKEIDYFMSPSFVLFKRMERLIERQGQRVWRAEQDNAAWQSLIRRTSIVTRRRDTAELAEIAPRIIAFLKQRNEHVLAGSLEEALATCKARR
ncbi:MAG: hypothetical protein V4486_00085 [Patescibacteria group bacterium]